MSNYHPTTEYNNMNNVVGNIPIADGNEAFKQEIKSIFDQYSAEGVNLIRDMEAVALVEPSSRSMFIDTVLESVQQSPIGTNSECTNDVFYGNYTERLNQLMENSMKTLATESVMTGYSPIVTYNPFFLKKQWIDCIFKDILMTEVPKSPIIRMGFERRYIKDLQGNEYPLPEALYNDEIVNTLIKASTGLDLSEEPIPLTTLKNLYMIDPTYIPGVIMGDRSVELTHNIHICKAIMVDSNSVEHTLPCNIEIDITHQNFVKGHLKYKVLDTDGSVKETLEDTLSGFIDFKTSRITVHSTTGAVTKVCLKGKAAGRWNQRSLDVVRRVEKIEKTMPESGPRLNSAITVEEAADALALQNIEMVADNVNVMGATLANMEDAEIKQFLLQSFENQKTVRESGILYNELEGENKMIAEAGFNVLPYDGYSRNITDWMTESREWFERLIGELKMILRQQSVMIIAFCHPNLVRFLQNGINWVLSDDTTVSGVKLAYNFGVYTSAQDRVHIVTSMRMRMEDNIHFVVIPLTQEQVTYKHYKYNVIIDRNYRNPMYDLVPNIMCTQRTLTFEVLPVQGLFTISGREMFSPETLKREAAEVPDAPTP